MIDSHAHVAFRQFDDDRAAVIERAGRAGVRWVEVGTDPAGSERAVALAQQRPEQIIGAAVGVHPSDAEMVRADDWQRLEALLDEPVVVAVGEVGFDYWRGGEPAIQEPVLARFVDLAVTHDLPLVLHVRDGKMVSAHEDMLRFLVARPRLPRAVVHTFSGTLEQAQRYLQLGLYVSFSGVVTFPNAPVVASVARLVPEDRFLLETDCPFLAPVPYRGKRNEPSYVQAVGQTVAALKGVRLADVERLSQRNTLAWLGREG